MDCAELRLNLSASALTAVRYGAGHAAEQFARCEGDDGRRATAAIGTCGESVANAAPAVGISRDVAPIFRGRGKGRCFLADAVRPFPPVETPNFAYTRRRLSFGGSCHRQRRLANLEPGFGPRVPKCRVKRSAARRTGEVHAESKNARSVSSRLLGNTGIHRVIHNNRLRKATWNAGGS